MNRRHILIFVRALIDTKQNFLEPFTAAFKIQVLSGFLKLPDRVFHKLTEVHIAILIDGIANVFDQESIAPCMKYMVVGNKKLHYPKEKLKGSSAIEFGLAETYYQAIIEENGSMEQNLNMLIGILFRAKGTMVDTTIAEQTARRMSTPLPAGQKTLKWLLPSMQWLSFIWYRVPFEEQFAAYYWYFRTREQLREDYPGAFNNSDKKSNKAAVDLTSQHGWLGMIMAVAESGPFGPYEETCTTDLHNFLYWIEYNHDRMQEMRIKNKLNGTTG